MYLCTYHCEFVGDFVYVNIMLGNTKVKADIGFLSFSHSIQNLPEEGVTVFANILHTHVAG